MPLQHISDRILKDMHRHVTKARILEILKSLRERVKDLTLRTTFITGFPGETEEEFNELLAFIKEQKFERCGVFPYSAEPRTPAAKMKDQVPAEVAEERAAKLMRIQKNIMKKANKAWIGREVPVLVDAVENGFAQGRAMMDAPEIDNSILFPAPGRKVKEGTFCQVRITDADSYEFTGEIVKGNRKK
jgi:ribosomal protein S12 methylthiotransferase